MSSIPTIYFIDDSATMREVIKIAFRRENINVVACHDAAMALAEIEKTRPDIVITDVIMPDKDGYDVCQYIKSHPELAKTPVVLMSGVVNRAVAEKAFAVRADELLRKPFQPQDLIARVNHLLKPNGAPAPTPAAAANAAAALTSIFSASSAAPRPAAPAPPRATAGMADALMAVPSQSPAPQVSAPPRVSPAPPTTSAQVLFAEPAPGKAAAPPSTPLSKPVAPVPVTSVPGAPVAAPAIPPAATPTPVAAAPAPAFAAKPAANGNNNDVAKLKIEILRLEGLIKKLQSELQAEREYARNLEASIKALQEGH